MRVINTPAALSLEALQLLLDRMRRSRHSKNSTPACRRRHAGQPATERQHARMARAKHKRRQADNKRRAQ